MTYLYPTASTVAVFVNGLHVEQAYQLQYKETFNKIPIYGYNDYKYSKVAFGKQIIQGVLVINFLFPGYLNVILDEQYNDKSSFVPRLYNFGFSENKESQQERLIKDINNKVKTELPPNSTAEERSARASYIASLLTKDKASKEATTKALQRSFHTQDDLFRFDKLDTPLEVNTKGVTLDIYYQDPENSTWFVRFHNVFFNEVSQVMSQAGAEGSSDPLYEVYSFIASDRKTILIKETDGIDPNNDREQ